MARVNGWTCSPWREVAPISPRSVEVDAAGLQIEERGISEQRTVGNLHIDARSREEAFRPLCPKVLALTSIWTYNVRYERDLETSQSTAAQYFRQRSLE